MDTEILKIFKDWGGHILSMLGIIGGMWAYFIHDRKLKNQEERLNELQIKQIEKVEAKEKMAEIKCNVIKGNRGNARIRFVNAGSSEARNVRIEILTPLEDMKNVLTHGDWGVYQRISPQSHREELIALCMGHPDVVDLKVTWDDDYKLDRTVELSVPL